MSSDNHWNITGSDCRVAPPVYPFKVDWPFAAFWLRRYARNLAKQAKRTNKAGQSYCKMIRLPLRYRSGGDPGYSGERERQARDLLNRYFGRHFGVGRLMLKQRPEGSRKGSGYEARWLEAEVFRPSD